MTAVHQVIVRHRKPIPGNWPFHLTRGWVYYKARWWNYGRNPGWRCGRCLRGLISAKARTRCRVCGATVYRVIPVLRKVTA